MVLLVYADMADPKPLVALACVCENALIEPDNVVSLIRVVDTFYITIPEGLPSDAKVGFPITAVVSVKSGDVTGNHEIALVMRQPNGKSREIQRFPIVLEGGISGANIKLKFDLIRPELGLYWIDVVWRNEALTSIPFRLERSQRPSPTTPT